MSASLVDVKVLGKTGSVQGSLGHIQRVNSSRFSVVSSHVDVRGDHTAVSEGTSCVTEALIELGDLLLDLVSAEGIDSVPRKVDETDPSRAAEFHQATLSPWNLKVKGRYGGHPHRSREPHRKRAMGERSSTRIDVVWSLRD